MNGQPHNAHGTTLIDVSDFARTEYGLSAATATAMLNYGYALLAIAGPTARSRPRNLTG